MAHKSLDDLAMNKQTRGGWKHGFCIAQFPQPMFAKLPEKRWSYVENDGPLSLMMAPIRHDLVGGLEHVLFSHIVGIIIPID